MKKFYLLTMVALMTLGLTAQRAANDLALPIQKAGPQEVATEQNKTVSSKSMIDIWTDDFDDPSLWSMSNDCVPTADNDWYIDAVGPTGQTSSTWGTLASISGGNMATFDLDQAGSTYTYQGAVLEKIDPIDCTGYPNLILSFNSLWTSFNTDAVFVELSADGIGWTQYPVHEGLPGNTGTDNPEFVSINISSFAGNEPTVFIRFRYVGHIGMFEGLGYAWMIDDLKISEQLTDDVKMDYTVTSQIPGGYEYASMPTSQIDVLTWGGGIINTGSAQQTNCEIAIEMTDPNSANVLSDVTTAVTIDPGDTSAVEMDATGIVWEQGMYNSSFTLTSDNEQPGADNFFDNTEDRVFAVNDTTYSLDGVEVYPTVDLTTLGTTSWPEAADNMFLMTEYNIVTPLLVTHIQYRLSALSVPGGLVEAFIIDTTDVQAGSVENTLLWLGQADEYTLTVQDSLNRIVTTELISPVMLQPGTYYATLKLSSLADTYEIRIIDDLTVPQPAWASAMYIPGFAQANPPSSPGPYTNGNAFCIRLISDLDVSIDELSPVSVIGQNVPNPARDITRIEYELTSSEAVRMVVTDITGKVVIDEAMGTKAPGVHSFNLNVSALSAGSYHYSIMTESGRATKKMTVVK